MKRIKLMISILLITTIALVSCKKDSSTGPGAGGDLVGIWNVVGGNFGWVITTNSNQVATNMFDVTGQVSVSGAVSATLNNMFFDPSDPTSFLLYNIDDDYTLLLDGDSGEGMFITSTGQVFLGTVTFNFSSGTLTITQSTITDVASSATVTIGGSLSFSQTNIPANTPTVLQFTNFADGDDFGLTTVEFKSDGTVNVTDVYEGETDIETWTYTTSGSQLTVTDEFSETMTYDYSVAGSTMTWNIIDSEDWCEDYATQAECFAEFEEFFDLDAGSVTNIGSSIEFVFSKATAKPGLNTGKTYNLINPTKVISDYKQKVESLKKSL